MSRPNQVDIWTLSDLCTPWCVHVVATLRIADHLTEFRELANAGGLEVLAAERHSSGRSVGECRPIG